MCQLTGRIIISGNPSLLEGESNAVNQPSACTGKTDPEIEVESPPISKKEEETEISTETSIFETLFSFVSV